ncbi:MAG TPA: phosphoribosyltransferase family protein [Planctomycetota bacterium]|nr:phosphoribosyltransferase family protein [Planctomycetota bacterium]
MKFADRQEAAEFLALRLRDYRGRRPLVLGLPPGGVVLGAHLAAELDADLDAFLVRDIPAPAGDSLGSVTESGYLRLDPPGDTGGAVEPAYVEAKLEEARRDLREQRSVYTPRQAPSNPAGRIVILVDECMTSSAAAETAATALRDVGAERVVVASPVAPASAVEALKKTADEVVCLTVPERVSDPGCHYLDLPPVDDGQVAALLRGDRLKGS